MRAIEFYTTPKGDVMLKPEDMPETELKETDYDFINRLLSILEEFYTDAYNALLKVYGKNALNKAYQRFLMIRRFIKCNFGNYDNMVDLDENWNFNFEFVQCPLRGECPLQDVVCNPKFNSKLTDRQMDVMRMLYNGSDDEDIAEALFISPETVKNHRKNSFRKLGIHSLSEFMRYANKNNLFNH